MALAATLFKGQPTKPDYSNVAAAVFLQPPVATCGMTEEEAVAKFKDVDIYLSTFKPMKNTLANRNEKALMKLVVDASGSDRVVGVHVVQVRGMETPLDPFLPTHLLLASRSARGGTLSYNVHSTHRFTL